jgi:hypothetical protein
LYSDVTALLSFFNLPSPPRRVIRSSSLIVAIYGFGNASGSGFGSSIMTPSGVSYRYGLWGSDLDDASSNFCELFNLTEAAAEHVAMLAFSQLEHLVDTVAAEAMVGCMLGAEFFLFTGGHCRSGSYGGSHAWCRIFSVHRQCGGRGRFL